MSHVDSPHHSRRPGRWAMPLAHPDDFSPGVLRIQERPPSPLAGALLKILFVLFAGVLIWAAVARLDIVAVAPGKLVPQTYLKIVQPPEQGVLREILVREGDSVVEGQVLIRMDAVVAGADLDAVSLEHEEKRLALRRVAAQLANTPLTRDSTDRSDVFLRVSEQFYANTRAHQNALAQERSLLEKARADLAAGLQIKAKLEEALPHYRRQDDAYAQLLREGFMGRILASDKARERQEKEQDLLSQEHHIRGQTALIAQSERRIEQISAEYRRQLQNERVELAARLEKLSHELTKHRHRTGMLELKSPYAGVIKDLATHTAGTVVAPGTILMNVVPRHEPLVAEVFVSNEDVGFVRADQTVRVKLSAFQFNKYGTLDGRVRQVSADATEVRTGTGGGERSSASAPLTYRSLVALNEQSLLSDGVRYALAPGMQVSAEIHLGTRSVLEYLLSPVSRAWKEAARER